MLAASAATATGEVNHVDFGHEVPAWLIGHDLGVKLFFAKDEAEVDSEDVAQEDKVVKVKEQDVKHKEMFAAKSALLVVAEKGDEVGTRNWRLGTTQSVRQDGLRAQARCSTTTSIRQRTPQWIST